MSKPCCEVDTPKGILACSVNRRRFLQALAGGLGVVMVGGCASGEAESKRPPTAIAKGDEWLVPGGAKLTPGQALVFRFPDESPGLVFLTAPGQWRALSTKCSHAGCTVLWQDGRDLLCPCHHSRFDLTGKVLNGPATESLVRYNARQEDEDIILKRA